MKHHAITAAMLLAALSMPTPAETKADPHLSGCPTAPDAEERSGVHVVLADHENEPEAPDAVADPQPQIEQRDLALETSRGLTPEEIRRIMPLILEIEKNGLGPRAAEAQQPELVRGPFLGLTCQPLEIKAAKQLGLKRSTGLKVTYVAGGGPASDAGVKKGDVLTALNDQVLVNAEQFAVLVRSHEIGDTVTLHGLREGEHIELETKLGEADVTPLGPGGSDLDQEWSIRLNPAQGPDGNPLRPEVEIAPGLWIGDGWGDPRRELMDDQDIPEQLRERIKKLEQRVFRQREEMDRRMLELRQQLGLKIEANGNAHHRFKAAMSWSDGQHTILIKNNDGQSQVIIKDRENKVICDVPLPEDGQVEGLPKDVQQKLDQLLNNAKIKQPEQPGDAEAPPVERGISNGQALPSTLAALEALEKNHENIVFDVWHDSAIDLAALRSRLGVENAEDPFSEERLIDGLQGIYKKIAGNSEMRDVLSQFEVREGLKQDLASIAQALGQNHEDHKAIATLIEHLNRDLLVQFNDDEHSIRLEGVGLGQRLTIEPRQGGKPIYSGSAPFTSSLGGPQQLVFAGEAFKALPQPLQAKVRKMLSDKRIWQYLDDGC